MCFKMRNKNCFYFIQFLALYISQYDIMKTNNVPTGKGQNVENHFVKSLKKNIESLKVD